MRGLELDLVRTLESGSIHEDADLKSLSIRDTANLLRQRKTAEVPPEFLLQTLTP